MDEPFQNFVSIALTIFLSGRVPQLIVPKSETFFRTKDGPLMREPILRKKKGFQYRLHDINYNLFSDSLMGDGLS